MAKWFLHDWHLYNLDNFNLICLGDSNEIILTTNTHNMDWASEEEEKICSLRFPSDVERDAAFEKITKMLVE